MDRSFYFDPLYPFQDEILKTLGGIDTGFYLSGGTAVSCGYLQHRLSDELRSSTALLDRQEPKDLADVWGFCCLRGLSIEGALADAGSKAAGVFPADLARILLSATPADWELVRWIEAPAVERFLADLRRLGEDLLLLHPPQ